MWSVFSISREHAQQANFLIRLCFKFAYFRKQAKILVWL